MKYETLALIGAFALASAVAEECHDYKLLFVPKATGEIVLDGKIDEAAWQKAAVTTDFGPTGYSYGKDQFMPKTELRILWDEKYLYVAATCYEDTPENMASFRVQASDRSGTVFNRDSIEFYLNGAVPGEFPSYQCILAPIPEGQILKTFDEGFGRQVDADFGRNADWQKAFSIGKDHWIVEARFAHASFGIEGRIGFRLGFNVGRLRLNKNFVTTKGEPTSVRFAQVFSWGNRKQYQGETRNGRAIFVERQPASVVEGLKLSYPDLEQRKVMVQTDAAYVVVDQGKVSELGYLDKAKQLVTETTQAYSRLWTLTNAVPEPRPGFYAGCFKNAFRDLAKLQAHRVRFAAATSCDVGTLDALVGETEKMKTTIEEVYYSTLRALMLAEGKVRFPVALKFDPQAPKVEDQFLGVKPKPWERTVEGVPAWLKPAARGRRKVLATIGHGDVYSAWELMSRLDLDCEVFVVENESVKPKVVRCAQEYHYDDAAKLAMLENLLVKNRYDGYLFIGCDPYKWPVKYQCALAERLLAGAKCMTVNGGPWGYNLQKDSSLLAGIPVLRRAETKPGTMFETEPRPCVFPVFHSAPVGEGSYAMWNPGRGTGHREHTSLLPGWTFRPEDFINDEYCQAAAVRAIARGLGLASASNAVERVVVRGAETDRPFAVVASLRVPENAKVQAVLVVRGREGRAVAPAVVRANAVSGHVTFAAAKLPTGKYFADVFLVEGEPVYDGLQFTQGHVCDFASAAFEVKPASAGRCRCSPLCEEQLPLPGFSSLGSRTRPFNVGEKITATLWVSNALEGLSVRAELRDPRERILERGVFPVDAKTGRVDVVFPCDRLRDNAHLIVATLVGADGTVYAEGTREIYRKRGRPHDFTVFTDGFNQGGINGKKRQALLEWYGIDLCQGGNALRLLNGGDACLRDRIAGGVTEDETSLASAAFLAKIGQRFRKDAEKIYPANGLLISCGDDSSVPLAFANDTPDWTALYWQKVLEDVKTRIARGEKMLAVTRGWAADRGIPGVRGSSWTLGYGFLTYLQPANCLAKLFQARLYPQDALDIRDACRKAYADRHGMERFNRQNGLSITNWNEITLEKIRDFKPVPSSTFVHFQFWLRDMVYGGDIAKLNATWHSDFKDFFDITQESIVALKEAGKYGGELDRRAFFRHLLDDEFTAIRKGIDKVDRSIPVFMGCTHYHNSVASVRKLGSMCQYWTGLWETKRFRRMANEGGLVGTTLGVYYSPKKPREQRASDVWRSLFSGNNLCWFWSTFVSFRGDLGVEDGVAGYTCEAIREIQRGPAALTRRSRRENDGIYLLYDTPSAALDGIYTEFGKTEDACRHWQNILENAGRSYDYLLDGDLEQGMLAKAKVKLLFLPCIQRLNEVQAAAIRQFVEQGGMVVADVRPAFVAANGDRMAQGLLDDVFGVTAAMRAQPLHPEVADLKAVKVNNFGKGTAVLLNFTPVALSFACDGKEGSQFENFIDGLFTQAKIGAPRCLARWEDGSRVRGIEISPFTRGGATYLGIEKLPVSGEKLPRSGVLDFGGVKRWTYDIRAGQALGCIDRLPLEFKGFDTLFLARLPYEVKAMTVKAPQEIAPGENLKVEAKLVVGNPADLKSSAIPVFRFDLIPPGGHSPMRYSPFDYQLIDARGGKATYVFPIAWNEPVGTVFTLEVTDLATGKKFSQPIEIRKL